NGRCPYGSSSSAVSRPAILGEALAQAIEGAGPTAFMPIALLDGVEDRLAERHRRPALLLREGDRDQGLVAPAPVLPIPGEGEDQALRRDDLAIDAALPELLAIRVPPEAQSPAAAGPQVAFQVGRREAARPHPPLRLRRIGPGLEDAPARRIEDPRDD